MRNQFRGALLSLSVLVHFANSEEVALHPTPTDPVYLSKKIYHDLRAQLGPAPTMNSAAQKADEEALYVFQAKRSDEDCKNANREVYVSLDNFFGPHSGILTKQEVAQLNGFFGQIRNDADYFIQQLKTDFPRQRPFRYLSDIKPCVPVEITGAYPSGHAVLSKLYALILAEQFPDKTKDLEVRAQEIAQHRVLSGMHHPTDIEAGRALAMKLFSSFMKSKSFKNDLEMYKAALVPVLAR